MHLFLEVSVKELPNFVRKYYLNVELLIFKYRWQNIRFPIQHCLLQSLVRQWRCVVRTCSMFLQSVTVTVAVSSLGCTKVVLYWSKYKGEWPVLSRCNALSTASASHSRPVWRLLYFSTGQRSCPQGRTTVQLLTCKTPHFVAPANSTDLNPVDYQIWGKLQERVSQPYARHWPDEVTPDQTVGTFPLGVHGWSDQAVASTSSSLHLSTWRTFWTHTLVMFDIRTDVHFDSHVCAADYSGYFCFWVTSQNRYNYCKHWQILLKFGNLLAIRHCIVGPEFC